MVVYVRNKDSDTWHWCKNCSRYPKGSDVVRSEAKPTYGELDNECKSKQDSGQCMT